jgi:CheY-like chemotaxis protein
LQLKELCYYSILKNNNNENDRYILLVDDDKDAVYTFDLYLKSLGFSTKSFVDPVEAFNYFYKNFANCALVITDYAMPQMSGFDLIKKIREKDKNYDRKIILISATIKDNFTINYYDEFMKLKVDKFLEKPLHLDKLKKEIEMLIE